MALYNMLAVFPLLLFVSSIQAGLTTNKTNVAYLAVVGSFGSTVSSQSALTITKFAAWYLNNQYAIAKDVEFQIAAANCGDGSGNPSKCLILATDIVEQYPNITGFMTGAYTNDQRVLQFVAAAFNFPHIVGTASGNVLSDKNQYPTLIRTSVADASVNLLMIRWMIENGWTKAAVALDSSDYGQGNRDVLQAEADLNNITLTFYPCPVGGFDFSSQAALIKDSGFRIIMAVLQPRETYVWMDAAYKAGLVGPDYAWILAVSSVLGLAPASIPVYQAALPSMNISNLRLQFDGAAGFAPHGAIGDEYARMNAYWTSPEAVALFPGARTGSTYGWFMVDGVFTYARGIQRMLDRGVPFANATKLDLLYEMWNNTDFNGTTGRIKFDKNGERPGVIDCWTVSFNTSKIARLYNPLTDTFETYLPMPFYGGSTIAPQDSACNCVHGTCAHGICTCLKDYSGIRCDKKSGGVPQTTLIISIVVPIVVVIALVVLISYYIVHRQHSSLVQELAKKQQSDIPRSEIKLNKKIGYGAAGEVYTALFRGTEVAIKRMIPKDINTNMLRQFKLETAIMCTLRHPNIVLFMGSCIDGGEMLLIMEYMNRGSLYSVLHDSGVLLPLSLRLHLAYQIASGINFLHRCNPSIIHCDIKSHNVLLDSNWCARISDFGIIKLKKISGVDADTSKGNHPIGTIYWTAPEILNGESQTKKSDCYAFGILLWELWHRTDPYGSTNPINVAVAVMKQGIRPQMDPSVPAPVENLIKSCWATNPAERPEFEQIMTEVRIMMMGEKSLTSEQELGAPSGKVIFVTTDVQDGDVLWTDPHTDMHIAMRLHNEIVRRNLDRNHGYEARFENNGFLLAFTNIDDAINFCVQTQNAMLDATWHPQLLTHSSTVPVTAGMGKIVSRGLSIRMAIHQGTPDSYNRDKHSDKVLYAGNVVDSTFRLLDYAPAGLIVLSSEIYQALLSSRVSSSLVTHKFSIHSPMDELVASTYIAAPADLSERLASVNAQSNAALPFTVIDVNDEGHSGAGAEIVSHAAKKQERAKWILSAEKFSQRKLLGKSLVADVFVTEYRANEVVVKVPFNQNFKENEIFDIKHTTAIISSFYHPNILGFMGICVNPLELVIEYAPNGNLKNYLASSVVISYSDKVRMCKDILQGLLYLSEVDEVKYRVHPNFKSSNILVGRNKELKLTDFAFSEVYDMLKTLTSVELTAWLAPEQLSGDAPKPTLAASAYSFGIIMWELYTRKVPYDQRHPLKLVTQIIDGLRPDIPNDCPSEYKDLMLQCWQEDPARRPTLSAVMSALNRL